MYLKADHDITEKELKNCLINGGFMLLPIGDHSFRIARNAASQEQRTCSACSMPHYRVHTWLCTSCEQEFMKENHSDLKA